LNKTGGATPGIAVERIIAVLEKNLLPPVAALRDMMRQTKHHNAGEEGHEQILVHGNNKVSS
jgi:hypothetical protein